MAPQKITIEYCTVWNYHPKAASLAEVIKKKTGITPELIASGGGVFEVCKDGELIFSKQKTGRFPEHEEILMRIVTAPNSWHLIPLQKPNSPLPNVTLFSWNVTSRNSRFCPGGFWIPLIYKGIRVL